MVLNLYKNFKVQKLLISNVNAALSGFDLLGEEGHYIL